MKIASNNKWINRAVTILLYPLWVAYAYLIYAPITETYRIVVDLAKNIGQSGYALFMTLYKDIPFGAKVLWNGGNMNIMRFVAGRSIHEMHDARVKHEVLEQFLDALKGFRDELKAQMENGRFEKNACEGGCDAACEQEIILPEIPNEITPPALPKPKRAAAKSKTSGVKKKSPTMKKKPAAKKRSR